MDVDLVRNWARDGLLPTFHDLLKESAWCQFELPPEYASGMVWPSINTGLHPAEHQSGFGIQLIDGSYKLRPRRSSDIRGQPFWRHFAEQGRRIVVADIPFSSIVPQFGGRQFLGWGQHDWIGGPGSEPAGLLNDLERQFGQYPLRLSMDYGHDAKSLQKLRRDLSDAIDARTRMLRFLAKADDWDFFYAAFPESHVAGHLLWHLSDERHPAHSAGLIAAVGGGLRETYIRLDKALGELLAELGDDTCKVVFFSHGMGPNYHGDHLFPELLRRFNDARDKNGTSNELIGGTERVWRMTIGRLPANLRRVAKIGVPLTIRRWASAKRSQNPASWRRSYGFAMPRLDGFSALRANLVGREPDGLVAPGSDYHSYITALESEIRSWTNAETGQAAVDRIYKAEDFTDPLTLGGRPDMMVWWSKTAPIRTIRSPRLGSVSGPWLDEKSGEHVMHSLFLLHHPEAAPGRRKVSGMSPTDVAPTLFELAGLEFCSVSQGRSVYADLFAACQQRNRQAGPK